MSSAFDFAEIMAASMQFGTTDTVEEVLARQEQREREHEERRKRKSKTPFAPSSTPRAAPVAGAKALPTSEMAKLRALLNQGGNRPPPEPTPSEVGSPPDE